MFLAHGPVGYLANELIQKEKIKTLKVSEQLIVAILSFIFGIIPDFDFFLLLKFNIPTFTHHTTLMHTPFFYLLIWIGMRLLVTPITNIVDKRFGKVLNKYFLKILVDTFFIATISHLVADLLLERIMFFFPLTDYRFYILNHIFEPSLFSGYFLSVFWGIEAILIAIFLFVFVKRFLVKRKWLNVVSICLIGLSLLFFLLTVFASSKTYNRSYMYDQEGNRNHDIDYDGQKDTFDKDIGNTGENNIEKTDSGILLENAYEVVNSGKWAYGTQTDIPSRLKYAFGAHSSYRLISQVYFNSHLPIEPVLRDFVVKRDGTFNYRDTVNYPVVLYEYMEANNSLLELNLDSQIILPTSRIFFLIDDNGEMSNMGITLDGNFVGIVLDDDEWLQLRSYEYLRGYYKERVSRIYIQR